MASCVEQHFGTDRQIGGWFIFSSGFIFLATFLGKLLDSTAKVFDSTIDYYTVFTFVCASCLFLIGSTFIFMMTYPDTFEHQQKQMTKDPKAYNFYFVGSWFYLFAYLSFAVWPIWAAALDEFTIAWEIALYFVAFVFGLVFILFFIFASSSSQLRMHKGEGSHYLFSSDIMLAFWGLFLISVGMLVIPFYFIYIDDTDPFNYLFLIGTVLTVVGFGIIGASSHPSSNGSLFCVPKSKKALALDEEQRTPLSPTTSTTNYQSSLFSSSNQPSYNTTSSSTSYSSSSSSSSSSHSSYSSSSSPPPPPRPNNNKGGIA